MCQETLHETLRMLNVTCRVITTDSQLAATQELFRTAKQRPQES